MSSLTDKMTALARDISELASVTAGFGWDRDPSALVSSATDLGAKPVSRGRWLQAMEVAVLMARTMPYLPAPVPSANPSGFPCLTWTMGRKQLDLQIRERGQNKVRGVVHEERSAFVWTQTTELGQARHESSSLRDLAQAMAATLPMPTALRCA